MIKVVWRRILIIAVVVLLLWAIGVAIFLMIAFREEPTSSPITRVFEPISGIVVPTNSPPTDNKGWALTLLRQYPYKIGSYSGVLPGDNSGEVWIVGRKKNASDGRYINVVLQNAQFTAATSESTLYTSQADDSFNGATVKKISPIDLLEGDPIAIRATYDNNAILASEVRLLLDERRF